MKKEKYFKIIFFSLFVLLISSASTIYSPAFADGVSTVPDTPTIGDQTYKSWSVRKGYNFRLGYNPIDQAGSNALAMIQSIDQIELTIIPAVGNSETFTNRLHVVLPDGSTPGFAPNNILNDTDTGHACNQAGEPIACWQVPENGWLITLEQLKPGTKYSFRIRTHNSFGWSLPLDVSSTSTSSPIVTPPAAPTVTSISSSNSRLAIHVNPPAINGGEIINGYHYFVRNTDGQVVMDGDCGIDICWTPKSSLPYGTGYGKSYDGIRNSVYYPHSRSPGIYAGETYTVSVSAENQSDINEWQFYPDPEWMDINLSLIHI